MDSTEVQELLTRFEKHIGKEANHALLIRELIEDGFDVDYVTDNVSHVVVEEEGYLTIGRIVGEPIATILSISEEVPW